jgi:hypothetical protein
MTASALRRHADEVLREELQRRRGPIARLPAERRAAVGESVAQAVAASVDGILDHASADPLVAAALESVYVSRSHMTPVGVAPD